MSEASGSKARSLRIRAEEVLARREAGEPLLVLDARSQKAWSASAVQIPGSIRIRPLLLSVDPSWPRQALVVVY
jgi:hypothetical protein